MADPVKVAELNRGDVVDEVEPVNTSIVHKLCLAEDGCHKLKLNDVGELPSTVQKIALITS